MTTFLVAFLVLTPNDAHEKLNPVFRELREVGVNVGAASPVKFPPPLMADGLSAKEQTAIIRKLISDDYDYAAFTRKSAVAPEKLVLKDIKPAAPRSVTRRAEVVCVAHGDLNVMANKEFLDRVLEMNRNDGKAGPVPPEKLKALGLEIKDADHEGFGFTAFNLLDKVQLDMTSQSFWSRTEESIVAAGRIDHRFRDDAEFPNRWRSLTKLGEAKFKSGKPSPYDGAGYYVKITRLSQPKGALFVEGHVIFQEPNGWFDGTNFLRSKLPLVIQKQVRSLRQELLKASK